MRPYEMFQMYPIKNIVVSRQLRWIGKLAEIEEHRLETTPHGGP